MGGFSTRYGLYCFRCLFICCTKNNLSLPTIQPAYTLQRRSECILTVTYYAYSFINQTLDKWIPIPGSPGRYYYIGILDPQWNSLYEVISTEEINEPDPGIFMQRHYTFYISILIQKRSILCWERHPQLYCIKWCDWWDFSIAGIELVSNLFRINTDGSQLK